jgi:hypothetical protein
MAAVWRFPCTPFADAAGVAATALGPTGSGMAKLPRIPSALLVRGARAILQATFEVTSTSATPTVTVDFRLGAVGSAIGSKIVVCASPALVINVAATAWPGIMKYEGTFRDLSPTAGVINGQGTVKSGFSASGGLAAQMLEFPMPVTAALRTVSTLVTSVDLEADVGITLSSVTGTPSILVTNLWAELAG